MNSQPADLARQVRQSLADDDLPLQRAALTAIERARDAGAHVPALLDLIDSAHWAVRKQAAAQLVRIGAPALLHIKRLLADGSEHQLYWCCYVLTQVEGRGAPLLASVLRSDAKEKRLCAIQALARRPAEDAIELLIEALDDPAWSNRKQAADILAARGEDAVLVERLKDEITRGNRNRVYWGVTVLANVLGAKTLPIMMKLMPWRDDDLRYLVLAALARLRIDGVLPLLLQHIGDRSPLIRKNIADLVVAFGSEAQEPLAELARTGSSDERQLALKAMARISPESFLVSCRRMLRSERVEDRYAAVQALGLAGLDEALEMLISCFQDPHWVIRRYASEEIRPMGERAIPKLLDTLRSSDEDLQFWSMLTLSRIGRSAWPHLKRAMIQADKAGRAFALAALAEADLPSEFVALFARSFEDEHWPIRHQAAECVRSMGPRALPHLLRPAFARKDNSRFWSRKLFCELGGEHATRFLEQLEAMGRDERRPLVDALERMHGNDLIALLPLGPARAAERGPGPTRAATRAITDEERAMLHDPELHEHEEERTHAEPPPPAVTSPPAPPPAPAPRASRLTSRMRALAAPGAPRPETDDAAALIGRVLAQVTDAGGMEVYLRGGAVPSVKYWNRMAPLGKVELAPAQVERMAARILGPRREATSAAVELSLEIEGAGRCRARVHKDAKGVALVLRPLGYTPPRLSDVGADPLLDPIPELTNGLVLVSGAAASGKTWTALALIEAINSSRAVHIATVESPVEHVNFPRPGFMSQVDVPGDFPTVLAGLSFARSSGASVIYVGDVPDGDTALALLEEAAAGTLVIATMRSGGAVEAIRRVVELASTKSPHALELCAKVLRASVRQTLLPHASGKSLVAAREVVVAAPRVLAPINLGRFKELEDVLAEGMPIDGCRSMAAAIQSLKKRDLLGRID